MRRAARVHIVVLVDQQKVKAEIPAGSQTLARGLTALQIICEAPSALTIQEVAERLDIHRTVASRLLATLVQFRLIARHDGRFRPAAGLAVLGASFDSNLRDLSAPVLRQLADRTHSTAALLVAEGEEQVALSVIVPIGVAYHLSFQEGSRYPINRGAAGLALLAAMPPQPGERDLVTEARARGWVLTHGEIEANAYGLAVAVRREPPATPTCINLVSHREDVLEAALPTLLEAAAELASIVG
jgi:DNA-binding IclR family transcriptional regulator